MVLVHWYFAIQYSLVWYTDHTKIYSIFTMTWRITTSGFKRGALVGPTSRSCTALSLELRIKEKALTSMVTPRLTPHVDFHFDIYF